MRYELNPWALALLISIALWCGAAVAFHLPYRNAIWIICGSIAFAMAVFSLFRWMVISWMDRIDDESNL
jgi:hypothetical protein